MEMTYVHLSYEQLAGVAGNWRSFYFLLSLRVGDYSAYPQTLAKE